MLSGVVKVIDVPPVPNSHFLRELSGGCNRVRELGGIRSEAGTDPSEQARDASLLPFSQTLPSVKLLTPCHVYF